MQSIRQILSHRNYAIALALITVMLVWLLGGVLLQLYGTTDQAAPAAARDLAKVQARYSYAQKIDHTIAVRGRTEANRRLQLRAEISGRVAAVPALEGSRVGAGDVVCQLAAEDRQLRLAQARAAETKARLDYDGAQRLQSGGYQSRTAIAAAKAALDDAIANTRRAELDLENLQIRAPYDAIVDRREVEQGDLLERGAVCATLLELNPLLVSGQVSETDVGLLAVGNRAQVKLLTGQTVEGVVRFIARESDPQTRGFRIEVALDNPDWSMRSGITADVSIVAGEGRAHRVSPSLLVLDDSGQLGLRVVDEQQRVRFNPVNLISGDASGVWVDGLPDKVLLITVGQHYVSDGELVVATIAQPSSARAAHNY